MPVDLDYGRMTIDPDYRARTKHAQQENASIFNECLSTYRRKKIIQDRRIKLKYLTVIHAAVEIFHLGFAIYSDICIKGIK